MMNPSLLLGVVLKEIIGDKLNGVGWSIKSSVNIDKKVYLSLATSESACKRIGTTV